MKSKCFLSFFIHFAFCCVSSCQLENFYSSFLTSWWKSSLRDLKWSSGKILTQAPGNGRGKMLEIITEEKAFEKWEEAISRYKAAGGVRLCYILLSLWSGSRRWLVKWIRPQFSSSGDTTWIRIGPGLRHFFHLNFLLASVHHNLIIVLFRGRSWSVVADCPSFLRLLKVSVSCLSCHANPCS